MRVFKTLHPKRNQSRRKHLNDGEKAHLGALLYPHNSTRPEFCWTHLAQLANISRNTLFRVASTARKTAFDKPPLFDPPPRSHGRKLLSHPIIANLKKWLHDNSVPNPHKANERHILAFLPSDTHVFGKFAEEFPKGHSFHMSHQSFHHKWKQYCPNIKVVNFLSLLSFHLRETTQTTSQLNQIKTQNFVFRSNQLPKLPVTIVASMKQFMNLLPSGRVRALT